MIVPNAACRHLLSQRQANVLRDIALEGLDQDCLDDAECLLDLLRLTCEPAGEVLFLRGLICVKREQWQDGIQFFESAVATGGLNQRCMRPLPFMAYCLMRLKEPAWHQIAEEIWDAGGSVDDLSLVGAMLGKSKQEIEMQARFAEPVKEMGNKMLAGGDFSPFSSLV